MAQGYKDVLILLNCLIQQIQGSSQVITSPVHGQPPFQGQQPFGIPVPGPLGPIPVGGGFNGRDSRGMLPDFSGDLLVSSGVVGLFNGCM